MKKILVILVLLVAVLSISGCYAVRDAAGAARTISARTFDGDNVIGNYEYFHSTYTEISSKVTAYNNYNRQMSLNKDQEMLNRMLIEQNGVFNYINDLCGQYNARSKMENRKLFKDKQLPFSLNFITRDSIGSLVEGE